MRAFAGAPTGSGFLTYFAYRPQIATRIDYRRIWLTNGLKGVKPVDNGCTNANLTTPERGCTSGPGLTMTGTGVAIQGFQSSGSFVHILTQNVASQIVIELSSGRTMRRKLPPPGSRRSHCVP